MSEAADPAFWEAWARGVGWDAEMTHAAGLVGSEAVRRGNTQAEAVDVVIARVRDGRKIPIGAPAVVRLIRDEGTAPVLIGAISFVAAGLEFERLPVALAFPLAFGVLVSAQFFYGIRGLTKRRWKVTVLGVAMTLAALAVVLTPSLRAP